MLQDIINEIPGDDAWKSFAFLVQTSRMNVYKPGLSKAYSGTFTSLTALFEWVQQVAEEIQKSVVPRGGKVATSTTPVVTPAVAVQARGQPPRSNLTGATALAATVSTGDYSQNDSDDDGDEDECVYITDVNMLRVSTEHDRTVEDIVKILGIEAMSIEQVITQEEWHDSNPDLPYKNIPRTMAAIRSVIGLRFRDTDLMSRLMQHVQGAMNHLCAYMRVGNINLIPGDLRGCMNSITHHLNPGSHTAMTCVQHPTGAHLCMQPFLNGLDRTPASLQNGCRPDLGCGECGKTGYKSCRAQKQYYFNVMVPAMLCEQFRVLQGYK